MPNESENSTAAPATTLEQRVKAIENNENRAFDSVKWGMGILFASLGAFTLIGGGLIGYNWWSAKTNYERDKESFQNRLGLIEKETALSNERQMGEIKKQSESSLIAISNNLQNAFLTLEHQIDEKRSNAIAVWSNAIMVMSTNMGTEFTRERTELNVVITNLFASVNAALKQNTAILNSTITNIEEAISQATAGANGVSAMVQGYSLLNIRGPSKVVNLADGTTALLVAAHGLFVAKDEQKMRACVNTLCGGTLMELGTEIILYQRPTGPSGLCEESYG